VRRTHGVDTSGRVGANVLTRMAVLAIALVTLTAYTTDHPGKNYPWLGLAAPDGRYEVLLGDGCAQIGPAMNVQLERSDDTNDAQWTLQLPGGDLTCSVSEWHWMGNTPCSQNADGECDVDDI